MSARAAKYPQQSTSPQLLSTDADPPAWAFPPSLVEHIHATSPTPGPVNSNITDSTQSSYSPTSREKTSNPFIGKSILVLSGAVDPLVPWSASKVFIDALYVGEDGQAAEGSKGKKVVVLEEGAAHECTPRMIDELAKFIWEEGVASPSASVAAPQVSKM